MSCLHATANFISNVHLAPDGTCAITELPEDVAAELQAESLNAGTFFQLVPALLKLFDLFRTEGATIAQVWEQLQAIIAIVRGVPVEALHAEEISLGSILKFIPLIIEIVTMLKGGGGSFGDILAKIMELIRGLKPA